MWGFDLINRRFNIDKFLILISCSGVAAIAVIIGGKTLII